MTNTLLKGPYYSVKDLAEKHKWPIGGIRHLIFNAQSNGFDRVIRRVGRKILVDENAFLHWIDRCQTETRFGGEE